MATIRYTRPWMSWLGIPRKPEFDSQALVPINRTQSVWPLHTLSEAECKVVQPVDFAKTPISAIFVYHDPRNWGLDVQVACDVIQSGGIIGGPYLPIDKQKEPVKLVFCNPDLIWRSDFSRPRLGQGAFRQAFQSIFKALTGSEYPYVQFGKPTKVAYEFAGDMVRALIKELYNDNMSSKLPPVYMIGDNPESDIAGANAAEWPSILVKTGVYDQSQGPPSHPPTHLTEDVEEAVNWAIQRELERTRNVRPA